MFPLLEILVAKGVVSVAAPPTIAKTKSLFSRSPVPSPLLYTASLKVILNVLLSAFNVRSDIMGGALSYSLSELFDCDVLAGFPEESKTAFSFGEKTKVSLPSGMPSKFSFKL